MNLSLEELRQRQKANPPAEKPVETPAVNPEWEKAPGRFPGLEPDALKPVNVGPPPVEVGFCRIFPASFPSLADVPDSWKAEFWSSPSPWCRIDGMPEHPDFEKNLQALENQ